MKDRIAELIEKEGLTPSRFADLIEVQRSNISHILAGRNKPSLDFLQKIIASFPEISGDWLLSGEGPMYKSTSTQPDQTASKAEGTDLFTPKEQSSVVQQKPEQTHVKQVAEHRIMAERSSGKRIKKIVVIYDDFSMDEFVLDTHLE
ncbi:helix-turn-helix transcriptional regulator [Saccharicrinis sp. FJH54]|uniref:helix-turn-helix transcriptional regulator n=1 Tax=Saccharicrinis sp. FJH54 TaxID=3344665 RepID=UPI0035D40FC1